MRNIGQYFVICNISKEEMLDPYQFGDGRKLMGFGNSGEGTLTGLTVLLRASEGGGGGDIRSDRDIVGSWAGDRIVIAGDYDEEGRFLPNDPETSAERLKEGDTNLYHYSKEHYEDVSDEVIKAIQESEGDNHMLSKIDLDSKKSRFRQIYEALDEEEK